MAISDMFNRFGVSGVFGFVLGVALAIWVQPTTSAGFGFIVLGGLFLTILIVEIARGATAVARRRNHSRD